LLPQTLYLHYDVEDSGDQKKMNKQDVRKLAYYFVGLVAVLTGIILLTVGVTVQPSGYGENVVAYHIVPIVGAVILFGVGGGLMIYITSKLYKQT